MSGQQVIPGFDGSGVGTQPTGEAIRASIGRELLYLLTISKDASRPYAVRPAGIAHSIGVCLIEDWNVARGKGKGRVEGQTSAMPRFVDVKLDEGQKENFLAWLGDDVDAVRVLQNLADDGYRVGVAWSGEHQTYTVSVTCRNEESENNGLCMTSFSRHLAQAVLLAWYKHDVVCRRRWSDFAPAPTETVG